MKMRSQILFAQAPTAIIIFLITLFFIYILTEIGKKSEAILVDNFKSLLAMENFNESLEEFNRIIINNPQKIQTDPLHVGVLKNKIEQQLLIQEANIKEPEEKELTQELHQKWEKYKEKSQFMNLNENDVSQLSGIDQLYKDIKQLTSHVIELNQDSLIHKKDAFSNFISNILFFITFASISSLIFGFFMSWIFTGLFLSPLDKMTEIISQIGKDDNAVYLHLKGSNEIKKLSDEFNLMTSRLEEYHRSSLGQVIKDYHVLKKAFDVFHDPVLLLNSKSDIIFMNQSALTLFEIMGDIKKINPFLPMEEGIKEALLKTAHKIHMTKTDYIPEKVEEALPFFKDGKKLFFLPWGYPIKRLSPNGTQEVEGVVIILQDLLRQPLSEISKAEVYETLIHEFQSPLNEIRMAIYTCLQETTGPLTEKQEEILYTAQEKCDYLERLCMDLLNFSQVHQKSQISELEAIDLSQRIANLITSLQLKVYQKGISIEVKEPPYLSKLTTNSKQIDVLLSNLFHNAIQYADPGTTIKVNVQEKKNSIMVSIHNQGSPIPLQYRKNIFKKYYKIPGQSQESAGLGLYIAQQIVQSLSGKIGFESSKTKGTTFWFELPLEEKIEV